MNALDPRRIDSTAALAHDDATLPLRDHAALLLREIRYELLRWLRTPSFALPTLLFPAMFYLLFGVVLNRGNPAAAVYLMARYGVFGVMAPALFGFGVGLVLDRERGLLTRSSARCRCRRGRCCWRAPCWRCCSRWRSGCCCNCSAVCIWRCRSAPCCC